MIIDIIERSIDKLKNKEALDILETLALSMFVGDDMQKYTPQELYLKINSSIEYTNFRNTNTILSNVNKAFLIGELLPFIIEYNSGNKKEGYILLNIESLCLPPTSEIKGDTVMEVLFSFNNATIIGIMKNTFTPVLKKEPIRAINKDDLFFKIDEHIRIDNKTLIFYILDTVFIIFESNYSIEIRIIPNLSENKDKIVTLSSLQDLEEYLGDNDGNFQIKEDL